MSITFSVHGRPVDYDSDSGWLNLSNTNARDLLTWLGYADVDLWSGDLLLARHLATQCRERLALKHGNVDRERPPSETTGAQGCRWVESGRPEGYLMDQAERLLVLADQAGDGFIEFG